MLLCCFHTGHGSCKGCLGYIIFLQTLLLPELFFRALQGIFCTLQVNILGVLTAVYQNSHTVIDDLRKPVSHNRCLPLFTVSRLKSAWWARMEIWPSFAGSMILVPLP